MDDEQPRLHVRLAEEAETLLVDGIAVRSSSAVAFALPESATVWDLSGLIIEGQPVKRQTLVTWLNIVYKAVLDYPYQQVYQPPTLSAAELFELLAFSDSVASSRAVCLACVSDSMLQRLRVQLCSPGVWERLVLDGREYNYKCEDQTQRLQLTGLQLHPVLVTEELQAQIRAQAAKQIELLLFIGHKFKLQPLLQRLHLFVYTILIYQPTSATMTKP